MTEPLLIHGVYANIGVETGDGRTVLNLDFRETPFPLISRLVEDTYSSSVVVGRVDDIWLDQDRVMVNAVIVDQDLIKLMSPRINEFAFEADLDKLQIIDSENTDKLVISSARALAGTIGQNPAWDNTWVKSGWLSHE